MTTLVGALSLGALGALTGYLLDFKGPTYRIPEGLTALGAQIGADLGAIYGGVAGTMIFAVSGLFGPPRRRWQPPRALLAAVLAGQILTILAVSSAFFGFENWRAWSSGDALRFCISEHLSIITFAAPAVMVCGQIAGALCAFRRERDSSRTDS